MWTTLKILSERAIRDLSGGDVPHDSPYDEAFVIEHIRDAMNEDLKLERLTRRGGDTDDKSVIGQMVATYLNVAVEREPLTKRTRIPLPVNIISLKDNKGIRQVSDMKNPLQAMIRIDNPTVTRNLPHYTLEKQNQGYYLEGLHIYFMRDILQEQIPKIMLKLLIAAPQTMDINEPLPLLPENIGRILDVVKQRMQARQPQDRIDDGNPNLRATNESRK